MQHPDQFTIVFMSWFLTEMDPHHTGKAAQPATCPRRLCVDKMAVRRGQHASAYPLAEPNAELQVMSKQQWFPDFASIIKEQLSEMQIQKEHTQKLINYSRIFMRDFYWMYSCKQASKEEEEEEEKKAIMMMKKKEKNVVNL